MTLGKFLFYRPEPMGFAAAFICAGLALTGCMTSPDAKSARHMEAGKRLLEKHDPGRAILEFRNAVQATPKKTEAYYQLALAYLGARDLARGVASLRKAIELDPNNKKAQFQLAQLMSGADDSGVLKEAQQRLEALITGAPNDAEVLNTLGLTELKLGHFEGAVNYLERALAAAPKELVIAVTLAEAKLQKKDFKGAEEVLKTACQKSPNSPEAAVILGRLYFSQKRLADAEHEFRRALTLTPDHGGSLLNLAILQNYTGRKQEAEETLKRLASHSDKTLKPLYATFLFEQGKHAEAVAQFEKLAKEDPNDFTARTNLVAAYRTAGRTADAERVLNDALIKNPKDLEALLQRGELAISAGKYSEAEADLNNVLHMKADSPAVHFALSKLHHARGATQRRRQELNETLRLNPALLPVRLELAESLIADRSAKAGLSVLDAAPEGQKTAIGMIEQRNWALLSSKQLAEARAGVAQGLAMAQTPDLLLQDALLLSGSKRYPDAIRRVQEALEKAPEDVRALRVLVQIYAVQNQTPAGVKAVQAYADKHQSSAAVQYFTGNLHSTIGDQAQAHAAFSRAKALDPNNSVMDMALARIDLSEANWDSARQSLGTILKGKSENPQARLWLGMLEAVKGNNPAAITHFRKVLESDPFNVLALNNLAYLLSENSSQLDEALKFAQKAKERAPDNPEIEDTLGWVLYRKGLFDIAAKHFERATANDVNSASQPGTLKEAAARRRYHLAMAYQKAGRDKLGRAALDTALRISSTVPEAAIAKQMFAEN